MTEASLPAASATTAGRLLREARERQGLHIVALSALIKVAPKKLEMLEADRLDALPDATFARALAQTVCRALKIDSGPVLALLPTSGHRLEQVGRSLNAPFRERPGLVAQRDGPAFSTSPAFWITGLILLAAVTVYLLPAGLVRMGTGRLQAASAPDARLKELPGMPPEAAASIPNVEPVAAGGALPVAIAPGGVAPLGDAASAAAPAAALGASGASGDTASAGILEVHTSESSWVEVIDARGQSLLARLMQAGETVGLDGAPPLRVRIGNAAATRVIFRGQPTELAAFTRDNVARLDLK
ncbi:MAG TPA: helix-turn-helix domain-containing protein [Caldimonas sp.]|jgi:cytoskeleton protein RodZ|nr:helix-turn-helix domain-containing protein [Caldimonas sp.]HEX2542809.1 helix-turn-helix domain-containing protein [Caldimonas sp.]